MRFRCTAAEIDSSRAFYNASVNNWISPYGRPRDTGPETLQSLPWLSIVSLVFYSWISLQLAISFVDDVESADSEGDLAADFGVVLGSVFITADLGAKLSIYVSHK